MQDNQQECGKVVRKPDPAGSGTRCIDGRGPEHEGACRDACGNTHDNHEPQTVTPSA